MKLFVLLLVFALSSASVLPTSELPIERLPGNLDGMDATPAERYHVNYDYHQEETAFLEPQSFDGIDLDLLTKNELDALIEAEDELFKGQLDVYLGINEIMKKIQSKVARPKRAIPFLALAGRSLFRAGRVFFKSFARNGVTRSGSRITQHYSKPGNYFTGLREFRKLNPTNVKSIGNSKFKGWTGLAGKNRVTLRSGSKGTTGTNGAPTLSIASNAGQFIRKFRYLLG